MVNITDKHKYGTLDFTKLGNNICEKREERGYSQEEFAEMIGVSRVTISSWENGKKIPSFENMLKICDALECDTDCILGREEYSTKELKTVCEYTGLSELIVKQLHETKDYPDFLSHVIESYSHDFELLISEIKECLINSTIEYYAQKLPDSHPLSFFGSENQKDSSIHLLNCLRLIERLSISAQNDDWILNKIKESPTLKHILPESDNT